MAKTPTLKELQQENIELRDKLANLEHEQVNDFDQRGIPNSALIYSLIQSLPLNVYAKNPAGRFIFANSFYCKNVGKSAKEIIGKTDYDIHPPDLAKKYLLDDQRIMGTRKTESIEEEWRSIGGMTNHISMIKSPIYNFNDTDTQQEILGTMGIFWDITERKLAEKDLKKSEGKYRNIMENIKEGYFELDSSYRLSFCNEAFSRVSGHLLSELTGTDLTKLATPGKEKAVRTFFNRILHHNSPAETGNFAFLNNVKQPTSLDLSISPIKDSKNKITGIRGMVRDITEAQEAEKQKKLLERKWAQAQKLESIGTLAGGIAHDFNNILFIIQGYTDLALADLRKEKDPSEKLKKVKGACTRATDLIEQILSFARHSEKERLPIDIRPIVKEVIKLLRSALPTTISIILDINTADSSYVTVDPTEIHQVVLNLCTNAGQAMAGRNGTLSVSLEDITVDGGSSQSHPILKPGHNVLLTITDTGRGIPQAIISRIFEPFFTTKKIGEGTGLGLSVVHGIITTMDGTIQVNSTEGQGTTFQIYLPVTEKTMDLKVEEPIVVPKGNGEHILLVDDDLVLLNMMASMLEELNYSCTSCANGSDAFDRFNEAPQRYDLLLTDQTMPGLTGDALSLAVRAVRQDIPIILCTGFSEQMSLERASELGINAFLPKPILMESLGKTMFDLLQNC